MVVVVFRSRLAADAGTEYAETAERMLALASAMPGFVSFKSFGAADGERLAVIEFESDAAAKAWREHPEHLQAQRRGREKFYSEYRIQVCHLEREVRFSR